MSRIIRFTFLVTPNERQMLARLADHYQRSQSDTMRQLIRQAYQVEFPNSQPAEKTTNN